ncbi:MAG: DMT family transporter [Actinobacteria bacterium]|nr:DMT family transporter [Actinomycetota bacterium]
MTGSRSQRHGWAWCAGAAVLFGAATPAIKLLVDDAGAVVLAGLLYLGAALAVAPIALRDPRPSATTPQRARLALAVAVGGGVAPVLLVLALDRTPAGTVSLLLNLELVATAVIAWLFLHEHIGARTAVGIVTVVAGGVVLAGTGSGFTAGALLVLGACICWGIDNAITASLDSYSPAQITLTKGVVAGTVNLVLGLALTGVPSARVIVVALCIGALGYGVSITMWITGARLVGAARGQTIFALAPFIGAVLAWPLNGEAPTRTLLVAFGVSLTGVLLVASGRHVHAHTHEPFEHTHPIDTDDPHHAPGTIEVLDGQQHRHLVLAHAHEHLPDIHHRHTH